MELFRMYLLIGATIILIYETSSQQAEIHQVIAALSKIAIADEQREYCKNNPVCLNNQACKNNACIDPCPGSCGINALCYVREHELFCKCPNCYTGNPKVECRKGARSFYCTF